MGSQSKIVTQENAWELAVWCGGKLVQEQDALDPSITMPAINVPVGEDSVERARIGSLIIRKEDGTFGVFQ
jgi:activator of HSP90 ATPase